MIFLWRMRALHPNADECFPLIGAPAPSPRAGQKESSVRCVEHRSTGPRRSPAGASSQSYAGTSPDASSARSLRSSRSSHL